MLKQSNPDRYIMVPNNWSINEFVVIWLAYDWPGLLFIISPRNRTSYHTQCDIREMSERYAYLNTRYGGCETWRGLTVRQLTVYWIEAQGWVLLNQCPPFRYFPIFLAYIWLVSPQLSCGDTCQIWMWSKESNRFFRKIVNCAYGEINERSFSNPRPWTIVAGVVDFKKVAALDCHC